MGAVHTLVYIDDITNLKACFQTSPWSALLELVLDRWTSFIKGESTK